MGDYVDVLSSVVRSATATDANGKAVALDFAVEWSVGAARRVTDQDGKIIFAGNGGSAGIASHWRRITARTAASGPGR